MELIPDLEYDGTQAKTDAQKAEILANFFLNNAQTLRLVTLAARFHSQTTTPANF